PFLTALTIVFCLCVLRVGMGRVFVALNGFPPPPNFLNRFRGPFALPVKRIAEIVAGLFLKLEVGSQRRGGEVLQRGSQITGLVGRRARVEMKTLVFGNAFL